MNKDFLLSFCNPILITSRLSYGLSYRRSLSVCDPPCGCVHPSLMSLTIQSVIGSRGDLLHFPLRPHGGPAAVLLELDLITVCAAVEDLHEKPENKQTNTHVRGKPIPQKCTQTHTDVFLGGKDRSPLKTITLL